MGELDRMSESEERMWHIVFVVVGLVFRQDT